MLWRSLGTHETPASLNLLSSFYKSAWFSPHLFVLVLHLVFSLQVLSSVLKKEKKKKKQTLVSNSGSLLRGRRGCRRRWGGRSRGMEGPVSM